MSDNHMIGIEVLLTVRPNPEQTVQAQVKMPNAYPDAIADAKQATLELVDAGLKKLIVLGLVETTNDG